MSSCVASDKRISTCRITYVKSNPKDYGHLVNHKGEPVVRDDVWLVNISNAEKYPDFKGNVAGVETRDFQRTQEQSPSKQDFHWMRNWETLYLIGKSMGDAMVGLLMTKP